MLATVIVTITVTVTVTVNDTVTHARLTQPKRTLLLKDRIRSSFILIHTIKLIGQIKIYEYTHSHKNVDKLFCLKTFLRMVCTREVCRGILVCTCVGLVHIRDVLSHLKIHCSFINEIVFVFYYHFWFQFSFFFLLFLGRLSEWETATLIVWSNINFFTFSTKNLKLAWEFKIANTGYKEKNTKKNKKKKNN